MQSDDEALMLPDNVPKAGEILIEGDLLSRLALKSEASKRTRFKA